MPGPLVPSSHRPPTPDTNRAAPIGAGMSSFIGFAIWPGPRCARRIQVGRLGCRAESFNFLYAKGTEPSSRGGGLIGSTPGPFKHDDEEDLSEKRTERVGAKPPVSAAVP